MASFNVTGQALKQTKANAYLKKNKVAEKN
jgi:hypothetical protein